MDGYICARSIMLFAVAGVALMSWLVSLLARGIRLLGERRALLASAVLVAVYAADVIYGYLIKGL